MLNILHSFGPVLHVEPPAVAVTKYQSGFLFQSEDYDVVSPISESTFKQLRGDAPDELTDDEVEEEF